jgi:hypothetical protein
MNRWSNLLLFVVALLPARLLSAELTPGNILVTSGDVLGKKLYEYTSAGAFVQEFQVPTLPGQNVSDYNRDIVLDRQGRVIVFNGTFAARFSVLTPSTGNWAHFDTPIMSVFGNGTYGKLAAWGDYVFACDHPTNGGESTGIVRLNVLDGNSTLFAPQPYNDEAIDLVVGADGLLYSLNGAGSPSGRYIQVFRPDTLEFVETITLPTDFVWGNGSSSRDLAVDSQGNFYLNQLYGPIYKLARNGNVLGTYNYTQTSYVDDMDIGPDGRILLTQFDGRVVLLNSSWQQVNSFDTTGFYFSQSFGGWVMAPVPEPATWSILSALLFILRRPRK